MRIHLLASLKLRALQAARFLGFHARFFLMRVPTRGRGLATYVTRRVLLRLPRLVLAHARSYVRPRCDYAVNACLYGAHGPSLLYARTSGVRWSCTRSR